MRIRSLKPEFWSHPVTGRQAPEVQAVLIGLLNYADDEGYFWADPAAVRSALRPFDEDSTNVRRTLARAQEIGFVEVSQHPSHGLIGRLPTFAEHQRIDRPSPSKIKKYWGFDSSNVRRTLDDRSLLEQGAGSREQGEEQGAGKATATKVVPLPPKPENQYASGEAYFAWLQHDRHENGFVTEKPPPGLSGWFSEVMLELNGDHARLDATVQAFARDKYWRDKGAPMRGLMSQWRKYVPRAVSS